MKHLLILHIHGSFASVSSSDKWLSREIPAKDIKSSLAAKSHRFSIAYKALSPDNQRYFDDASTVLFLPDGNYFIKATSVYDGWTTYYTADAEFYHQGLHSRGLPHFDITNKVAHYLALGFNTEDPVDYTRVKKAHDEAETTADIADRTRKQYVFPDYKDTKTRESMQGGLSDEVFNEFDLVNYMKPNDDGKVCCFGYVGNSNRRVPLDRFLETHMRDTLGWSLGDIAVWLTSSDGRHMADSYESPNDCLKWLFTNYAERERETA